MGTPRLLIAAVALLAVPPPPADREFPGKRIPVTAPPRSQFASPSVCAAVGEEIGIGSVYFAAAVQAGGLLVATTPGTPATTPVVEGKPVRFSWDEKGTPRSVLLTFARDDSGRWIRFASEALRFPALGEDLRLYDGDGDGRYGIAGRDGWARGSGQYIIPMQEHLVLGTRILTRIRVDADRPLLVAAVAPCPGAPCQVAAIAAVNNLRCAHGLPPVVLDEALSAGCTIHAKFLNAMGWAGPTDPYPRGDGNGGEAPEGIAAAAGAMIGTFAPELFLEENWRSFLGRGDMGNPLLRQIGVNAEPRNIYVVNCRMVEPEALQGDRPTVGFAAGAATVNPVPAWPVFVPADGTEGHPVRASQAGSGEPIPDFRKRGCPLNAFFEPGTNVVGFTGSLELVDGGTNVPVVVPDLPPRTHQLAILPASPLLQKTWYRATFRWTVRGVPGSRTIRFKTQ